MECYNCLKTIHFQRLSLSFIQTMADFRWVNMYARHLRVTIKRRGQVHGQ